MPGGTVHNPALGYQTGPDDIPTLLKQDLDTSFTLNSAYLVFFMQCGFALLECGSVRGRNTKNILLKNVMDLSVGVLCWWGVGYAFAYGTCGDNVFIGHANFFTSQAEYQTGAFWAHWLFTMMFCLTSNALVHGAVSERMQFGAYLVYTFLLTSFVYPVVVHWTWSLSGWLSPYRIICASGTPDPFFSSTNGLMDFAGSGSVHIVGGVTAFWGALVLGPRLGRFTKEGYVIEMAANSPAFQVLGTFALWFGWYGFNPGSTGCFYGCMLVASKVAVNTTLAAATGGLAVLFASLFLGRPGDIGPMLNGILAALVAITSPCAYCMPYAAVFIGMVAGFCYLVAAWILRRLRVDDVLETSAVHLGGGIWGVISVGFFATETSTRQVYGFANDWGVLYGGNGKQLGIQVLGVVVIMGWVTAIMLPMWLTLKYFGLLRVEPEQEKKGLDIAQSLGTGVPAWNFWMSGLSRMSMRSRRSNQSTSSDPPMQGTTIVMPSRDSAYNGGNSNLVHMSLDQQPRMSADQQPRMSVHLEGQHAGYANVTVAQAVCNSIRERGGAENPQVH